MSVQAWTQMEPVFGDDYERFWTKFYERFHFRASTTPDKWPGIAEPAPSVTFSLAPILSAGPGGFEAGEAALNAEVLRALVLTFGPEDDLVAMDWQHPSYWFRPHAHALANADWQISPFPNGDYYMIFSQDLSMGTFGHPWEGSICVIGAPLIEVLAPVLSGWLPVLRRTGA